MAEDSIRYKVAVVGASETTKIGKVEGMSNLMLAADAAMNAIRDCGIDKNKIDGVFSASDYPGAIVAAAIATRLGLHGAKPEAVLRASHKYYSRRSQREVAPEAVPRFALVRPGGGARLPFPFPVFVKPVKGSYSVLARRVHKPSELEDYLASPEVREFTNDYLGIFNRLVAAGKLP